MVFPDRIQTPEIPGSVNAAMRQPQLLTYLELFMCEIVGADIVRITRIAPETVHGKLSQPRFLKNTHGATV